MRFIIIKRCDHFIDFTGRVKKATKVAWTHPVARASQDVGSSKLKPTFLTILVHNYSAPLPVPILFSVLCFLNTWPRCTRAESLCVARCLGANIIPWPNGLASGWGNIWGRAFMGRQGRGRGSSYLNLRRLPLLTAKTTATNKVFIQLMCFIFWYIGKLVTSN